MWRRLFFFLSFFSFTFVVHIYIYVAIIAVAINHLIKMTNIAKRISFYFVPDVRCVSQYDTCAVHTCANVSIKRRDRRTKRIYLAPYNSTIIKYTMYTYYISPLLTLVAEIGVWIYFSLSFNSHDGKFVNFLIKYFSPRWYVFVYDSAMEFHSYLSYTSTYNSIRRNAIVLFTRFSCILVATRNSISAPPRCRSLLHRPRW